MFTHASRLRSILAGALVAALATQGALPAFAASAGTTPTHSGASLVSRAQGLYAQARYGEATTLLTGPVNRGELSGTTLRDARVLLGRCYVQTGNTARAKEYFAAVIADDPDFVLDKAKAGQDEIDVFNQAKTEAAARTGTPAHQPTAAELGTSSGSHGWLATHKTVAALVVVGAGAIGVAAASGGGSSSSGSHGTATLGAFPSPPSH